MQLLQLMRNVECLMSSSIQKDFFLDATGHHKLGICMLQQTHFPSKHKSKIYTLRVMCSVLLKKKNKLQKTLTYQ